MKTSSLVYVIDDDPSVGRSTCVLFKSFGLAATAFTSTAQFLREYQPGSAACLVLDLRLENESGLEFISEMSERKIRLPVILTSGDISLRDARLAREYGAFEILEKPIAPDRLLDCARRALEQSLNEQP